MLMPKYLVSSVTRIWAVAMAAELKLHPTEWCWVPAYDEQKRAEVLAGMMVDSQSNLLGYFTPHEIFKLTGGYK